MVQTIIKSVGPGREFATLAAFATALPPDLVAADQAWVAELYADGDDPGGVVIDSHCDATRFVELRAAPGQGIDDLMDPTADPLRPTSGKGAMIRAVTGDAVHAGGPTARVVLRRLQIVAEAGAALSDNGAGRIAEVEACLIAAETAGPAVTVTGGVLQSSVVVQNGSGDGVALAEGAQARGCTVFKPARLVADGTGIGVVDFGSAVSTAVFGYGRELDPALSGDALAAGQDNILPAPTDLTDPFWNAAAATVSVADTIPGAFGQQLQRTDSNFSNFARFEGAVITALAPGARIEFSCVQSPITSLSSAILLDSAGGKPELRVIWQDDPVSVLPLDPGGVLALVAGGMDDLGGGLFRLRLVVENTSASPLDVRPFVYTTRGFENTGLNVSLYMGEMMLAVGHIGNGLTFPGTHPGTNPLPGVDPAEALVFPADPLDLRARAGGPLDGVGASSGFDLFRRTHQVPTIGAQALSPSPQIVPLVVVPGHRVEAARLVDRSDILDLHRDRLNIPASPSRVVRA